MWQERPAPDFRPINNGVRALSGAGRSCHTIFKLPLMFRFYFGVLIWMALEGDFVHGLGNEEIDYCLDGQ